MDENKDKKKKSESIILQNGNKVYLNDFIYFEPEGESSYNIGRITEINSASKNNLPSLKVEQFYRKSDIFKFDQQETNNEPRKLYSSFLIKQVPLTRVREVCTVTHINNINNLLEYVKMDHHFYFNQLYYKKLNTIYNIIPTKIMDYPIKKTDEILKQNYAFILCDIKETVKLISFNWNCISCSKELKRDSAKLCNNCYKPFHIECFKNANNNQNICSNCLELQHKLSTYNYLPQSERMEGKKSKYEHLIYINNFSYTIDEDIPINNNTPFLYRYVDANLIPEKALMDDTLIPEPNNTDDNTNEMDLNKVLIKGKDVEVNLMGIENDKTEFIMNKLEPYKFPVPKDSYKFQKKLYEEIEKNGNDFNILLDNLLNYKYEEIKFIPFSQKDILKFETLLIKYGPNINMLVSDFKDKSKDEIEYQFYTWKKDLKKLSEERSNIFNKKHTILKNIVLNKFTTDMLIEKKKRKLIIRDKGECTNCKKEEITVWFSLELNSINFKLCPKCAYFWKCYKILKPIQSEEESLIPKKNKINNKELSDNRNMNYKDKIDYIKNEEDNNIIKTCFICKDSDLNEKVNCCIKCSLIIHDSCLPISNNNSYNLNYWNCEWCKNRLLKTYSNNSECMICRIRDPLNQPKPIIPTNNNNWVHIICSIYLSNVSFNNNYVNGVYKMNLNNWELNCNLCNNNEGIKIQCLNCDVLIHPSCCHKNQNYFMGFKKGESNNTNLIPIVLCNKHSTLENTTNLVKFSNINNINNKTYLNQFILNHTLMRENEMKIINKINNNDNKNNSNSTNDSFNVINNTNGKQCFICNAKISLSWWILPNNVSDLDKLHSSQLAIYHSINYNINNYNYQALICHSCRWKIKEKEEVE